MLNVSLLGGACFAVDGAIVRADLGLAGRLLACYLFEFDGRMHRRERLADLFWGELEPERARSALNTAIWRIRKMLELGAAGGSRTLITMGDDVLFERSDSVRVDTHFLESVFKRVISDPAKGELMESHVKEVIKAVECYRGPFLDGDDADWVRQERERLHSLYVRTAVELMRAAARSGQHEAALQYGREILAADPFRESVQCDVMLLLLLDGQRAEAIRAYQNLRSVLRSDLGIEPMPATKSLHGAIVSGEIFSDLGHYTSSHFGS